MAQLRIEINLDNAAFDGQEGNEVAHILRQLADDVDDCAQISAEVLGALRDSSGNTVGVAKL